MLSFGYTSICAVAVVEGATHRLFAWSTTMVIGILISITAIGILCWLLFTLAIYALPLFAGVAAGSWAYEMGAGWPGGILAGLITAGLTLGLGQFLFTLTRPAWLRLAVGLVFAAPAALAGYHAVHGIA